jgi:hypothetical protein
MDRTTINIQFDICRMGKIELLWDWWWEGVRHGAFWAEEGGKEQKCLKQPLTRADPGLRGVSK